MFKKLIALIFLFMLHVNGDCTTCSICTPCSDYKTCGSTCCRENSCSSCSNKSCKSEKKVESNGYKKKKKTKKDKDRSQGSKIDEVIEDGKVKPD